LSWAVAVGGLYLVITIMHSLLDNVRSTLDVATEALFQATTIEERKIVRQWLLASAQSLTLVIAEGDKARDMLLEVQIVAETLGEA